MSAIFKKILFFSTALIVFLIFSHSFNQQQSLAFHYSYICTTYVYTQLGCSGSATTSSFCSSTNDTKSCTDTGDANTSYKVICTSDVFCGDAPTPTPTPTKTPTPTPTKTPTPTTEPPVYETPYSTPYSTPPTSTPVPSQFCYGGNSINLSVGINNLACTNQYGIGLSLCNSSSTFKTGTQCQLSGTYTCPIGYLPRLRIKYTTNLNKEFVYVYDGNNQGTTIDSISGNLDYVWLPSTTTTYRTNKLLFGFDASTNQTPPNPGGFNIDTIECVLPPTPTPTPTSTPINSPTPTPTSTPTPTNTPTPTPDTTPPVGSITIVGNNNNQEFSNTRGVTLKLTCTDSSGCSSMKISTSFVAIDNQEEIPFSKTKSFTLSDRDGTHAVFVKFKDSFGNWSNTSGDSIILDRPPLGTTGGSYVKINNDQQATISNTVNLSLNCVDTLTSCTQMKISNTLSGLSSATPIPYSQTYTNWSLDNNQVGNKAIYVIFSDTRGSFMRGNDAIADSIVLDRTGALSGAATVSFIDYIQGAFYKDLPRVPFTSNTRGWGAPFVQTLEFLEDVSIIYTVERLNNLNDIWAKIPTYDVLREEVKQGRTIQDILNTYKGFVSVTFDSNGNRIVSLNATGKNFLDFKYNSIVKFYDEKCAVVNADLISATTQDKDFCNYFSGKRSYILGKVKMNEERIIKELGANTDPIISQLALYDTSVRQGRDGQFESAGALNELAKWFDSQKTYGSAAEVYGEVYRQTFSPEFVPIIYAYKELVDGNSLSPRGWMYIGVKYDPSIEEGVKLCQTYDERLSPYCASNPIEILKQREIDLILYMANYDDYNKRQAWRASFEEFALLADKIAAVNPNLSHLKSVYDFRQFISRELPPKTINYDLLISEINKDRNFDTLHALSEDRLASLHSAGHKSKRILYHLVASTIDPINLATGFVPFNACGNVTRKLCTFLSKLTTRPKSIIDSTNQIGKEATIKVIEDTYGLTREQAETAIDAAPKLNKGNGEEIDFVLIVGQDVVDKIKLDYLKHFTPDERIQVAIQTYLAKKSGKVWLSSFEFRIGQILERSPLIRNSESLRSYAFQLAGIDPVSYKLYVPEIDDILDLLEFGPHAPKEALDIYFNNWVKSYTVYFANADGNYAEGVEKSIFSVVTRLRKVGASNTEIEDVIKSSNSFNDFISWGAKTDEELDSIFTISFANFLKDAGISEESLGVIKSHKVLTPIAILNNTHARVSYELYEKYFKPIFGLHYQSYTTSIYNIAISSLDEVGDLNTAIEKAVSVAEELAQIGIDRDIIINLSYENTVLSKPKTLTEFTKLLSNKDELISQYVAAPVPELQNYFAGYGLRIIGNSVNLPKEFWNYSKAQIIASVPNFIDKGRLFEVSHIPSRAHELTFELTNKISDNYLFRAEGSQVTTVLNLEQSSINIDKKLQSFFEQGGVGFNATTEPNSGTFVSDNLDKVIGYTINEIPELRSGVWIIQRNILSETPLKIEANKHMPFEIQLTNRVKLSNVKLMIVTPKARDAIFARFGRENTEVFGGRTIESIVKSCDSTEINYYKFDSVYFRRCAHFWLTRVN